MSLRDIFFHPAWVLSTAVLAVVVRLQRRLRWAPEACDVRLTGKTAIVTGANTGNSGGGWLCFHSIKLELSQRDRSMMVISCRMHLMLIRPVCLLIHRILYILLAAFTVDSDP